MGKDWFKEDYASVGVKYGEKDFHIHGYEQKSAINNDSSQVDKVPSAKAFSAKYVEIKIETLEYPVVITEQLSMPVKWAVVNDYWHILARFVFQDEAEIYLQRHPLCKIVEMID